MKAKPAPCPECQHPPVDGCAHVDCPCRRQVTARQVGSVARTESDPLTERRRTGTAVVRRPNYFED